MSRVELELERVAHGGWVVGRHEGKVVFVSGGLPGERVLAEVTSSSRRFDRARVVGVLRASADRVPEPCPIAGSCGGCDWQHVLPEAQTRLKSAVVAEQLSRLAGIDWEGEVQAVGGAEGSRSRMRYAIDADGNPGLRGRRSHEVIPLPAAGCLVAAAGPTVPELRRFGDGVREVEVVNADGVVSVLADGKVVRGPAVVDQRVGSHRFRVAASGFWQVHPRAAEILSAAVLDGLAPVGGEVALDLYCGVGLFAAGLVDAGCRVTGVEADRESVAMARRNVEGARFLASPVERALSALPDACDLVVLDPPRRGAGADVVAGIARMAPRAIAYVACDPAALARDLASFSSLGYQPALIRAWDLFPMTAHVECVAILQRS